MRRRQFVVASTASVAAAAAAVHGQSRPIRMVVPFAPGGSGDVIPRTLAPFIGELLGQPVIVDNVAGAGGVIGAAQVARSAADGFTLGVATVSTHGIQPVVRKHPTYDPLKDFVAISNMARVPNIVSVNPTVPVRNLAEFVQFAKDPRSNLDYGSPGVGSLGHMMGELFKQSTKAFMVHVPYRGAGPALADTVAGHVKMLFDNLSASLSHVRAGRLRGLAVAWPSRVPQLPDIPTFAEAGVPALNDPAWFGLVAPAGTPTTVVTRIQRAIARAMAQPAVRARIEELGAVPVGGSSEEFAKEIAAELQKWRQVAKTAGVFLES